VRNSLVLAYHPFSFLQTGWKHRSLIRRLTVRKVEADYRGSALGLLWTLLHPLLLLSVYTFVFSVIFRARWDGVGKLEVALLVFSGLILYTVFSKCVNEAPNLMITHQTYIKQVVFPAEVLAWVCVLAALFDFAVGCVLLRSTQSRSARLRSPACCFRWWCVPFSCSPWEPSGRSPRWACSCATSPTWSACSRLRSCC